MPLLSQKSTFQLRKDLQEVEERIAKAVPELIRERDLIREFLEAREAGEAGVYAKVSGPTEAIELCLNLAGDEKLTKKDIIRRILEGGYMSDKPRSMQGVMNNTLNTLIRTGRLALRGDVVVRVPKKKEPREKQ